MARSHYDETFNKAVCTYFETDPQPSWDSLKKDLLQKLSDSNPWRRRYLGTLESLRLLGLNWSAHNRALAQLKNTQELRIALLLSLGYIQEETDQLSLPFFRRGRGRLDGLSFDTAIKVASFLETFPTRLLENAEIRMAPELERAWFHYDYVKEITLDDLLRLTSNRERSQFRFGKYHIRGIPNDVGLNFIRLKDFEEITLTVDISTSVSKATWSEYLLQLGQDLGLAGPYAYTVAAPFLCQSSIRIHRMTWPHNADPRTRVRIYSRMVSPRTELAEFYTLGEPFTMRYPKQHWSKAVVAAHQRLWQPLIGKPDNSYRITSMVIS